jgi:hypothetical protein
MNKDNMNCKICGSSTTKIFNTRILKKYDVDFFSCSHCGFVQTEEPFWLEEAYDSSINVSDTGILQRNLKFIKYVTNLILFTNSKSIRVIDYAGGYGIFTRLMRDIGFDCYWHDPYTVNLLSRGFEADLNKKYDLLTTFESFEHFASPLEEIEKIIRLSDNVLFSTVLAPDKMDSSWYYLGLNHGQHISFYKRSTLNFLAKKYNVNYYQLGPLHYFTPQKISKLKEYIIKLISKSDIVQVLMKNLLESKTFYDNSKLEKL